HQQTTHSCGHGQITAAEWCEKYKNSLQSSIRCPINIKYYMEEERLCSMYCCYITCSCFRISWAAHTIHPSARINLSFNHSNPTAYLC
ncbi:uncharacterized protein PpBr36_11193, partial [Pyricularia pennisetigena]|uniref:uncharacterized protein n=1 Tax=Pyricularia pennisetigena TaxID=1578925 RepID=UPI0011526EA9